MYGDPLADLAYNDAHDSAMFQHDKWQDKAVDAHERGDEIGARLYLSVAGAWAQCRHSLTQTPFNWGGHWERKRDLEQCERDARADYTPTPVQRKDA